jgi:hypothetical protein
VVHARVAGGDDVAADLRVFELLGREMAGALAELHIDRRVPVEELDAGEHHDHHEQRREERRRARIRRGIGVDGGRCCEGLGHGQK